MAKLLEVIVTSAEEAAEAEAGGADRLELVRELGAGGLTPTAEVLEQVLARTRLPVRVMLRNRPDMLAGSEAELKALVRDASHIASLPVDGLVLGFVRDGAIDVAAMDFLLAVTGNRRLTFHRAFESVTDAETELQAMGAWPQIDRILVRLNHPYTLEVLERWQNRPQPRPEFIVGVGLAHDLLDLLAASPTLNEIHVGRAVREPELVNGRVESSKVAALKRRLQ